MTMKHVVLPALALSLALSGCAKKSTSTVRALDVIPMNAKGDIREGKSFSSLSGKAAGISWFNQDPMADLIEGASVDKAMRELIASAKGNPIIVAVVDSGVDINHDDLKGKIWTNTKEIPDNGIDDDGNGYVDDVHGWNFLGGKDGRNVSVERLEVTREYARLQKRLDSGEELRSSDFDYYKKVKAEVSESLETAKSYLEQYQPLKEKADYYRDVLRVRMGLTTFDRPTLEKILNQDAEIQEAVSGLLKIIDSTRDLARLDRIVEYYGNEANFYYNISFDARKDIIGDDPSDFSDRSYGNNNVIGPDPSHGTHVSGIIAANRGNGIGIDGVATNVQIMPVRAVPDGDEADKDVANAIYYAVDNGARIINMSFGKAYSPYKMQVDAAMKYAAEKGVLLVHSAGNESLNIDENTSYPNPHVLKPSLVEIPETIGNWITVGASSSIKGLSLPGSFSNYGKSNVDLFSPGVSILSTTPNNTYDTYSGTSMASPVVSGVAALVLSQHPKMTGEQLRNLMLYTARPYDGLKVKLPGAQTYDLPVDFSGLSSTGGIVDAYAMLKLAKELAK